MFVQAHYKGTIMQLLFTRVIPFPSFISGRKKKIRTLCSLNNISKWKRFKGTDIKNQFKQDCYDMYIPEPALQYDTLTIKQRIVRHNDRKFDQDNAIFFDKFLFDALEDMGYVKDDKTIQLQTFPSIVKTELTETMMEVQVWSGSQEWTTQ